MVPWFDWRVEWRVQYYLIPCSEVCRENDKNICSRTFGQLWSKRYLFLITIVTYGQCVPVVISFSVQFRRSFLAHWLMGIHTKRTSRYDRSSCGAAMQFWLREDGHQIDTIPQHYSSIDLKKKCHSYPVGAVFLGSRSLLGWHYFSISVHLC